MMKLNSTQVLLIARLVARPMVVVMAGLAAGTVAAAAVAAPPEASPASPDTASKTTASQAASKEAVKAPEQSDASTYAQPTWTTYYRDMDAIRADTERANAILSNMKIHHQIDLARAGNFTGNETAQPAAQPAFAMPPSLPLAMTSTPAVANHPLVEQVSMVDGKWSAQIRLVSGAFVTAGVGQTVQGVGKITAISLYEVLAEKDGKTVALPFGATGMGVQDAQSSEPSPAAAPMRAPVMPGAAFGRR